MQNIKENHKIRKRLAIVAASSAVIVIFATGLFSNGCAGPTGAVGPPGPMGPPGPPGPPGTAEVGLSAEACSTCHNEGSALLAKQLQYQKSGHFVLGDFERSTAECAVCHTNEGFVERIATGSVEISGDISDPTPQNCRTCHQIHETYTEDDWTLRTDSPVTLELTGDTIDLGEGNICANCHQPRWSYEIPQPGGGPVEITSTRYGPHHGPQSAMLTGLAGYGDWKGSNVHADIPDGCITCHGAEAFGTQAGGHTWWMEYEYHGEEVANVAGCVTCHEELEELETFDRNGVQTEIKALGEELKALLVAQGIMNEDDSGIPGTFSSEQAGALWNYKTVMVEDKSYGIHNPHYAKFLLETGIEALK